jgi:UDP-GlcNAc:undecaprenyl-phosphate GlcNAc-1-phosphate transferase
VAAVVLRYESDGRVLATGLLVIVGLFGGLFAAERAGWRAVRRDASSGAGISAWVGSPKGDKMLREASRLLIAVLAPALMLLGSLWVARIPRDIGLIAALLAAVLAAELGLAHVVRSLVVRMTVYVAAIASAYLVISYPGLAAQRSVEISTVAVVVALVAAIGAYIRFTSDEKFGTTPTDYLIVFAMVALMVFAGIDSSSRTLVEIVVYAVVLLYGCEVLIGRATQRWNGFNVATLLTLSIMAIRGLLFS